MSSESNFKSSIQSSSYKVHFGHAAEHLREYVSKKNNPSVFVLCDTNTAHHCLPLLAEAGFEVPRDRLLVIPAGEQYKQLDTCQHIWDFLHAAKADRRALMINLGGGVLTDMGGFSASVFKRGIDFIQVPTSLLSQVDASVGTKTGVDFRGEKNMIGTFTPPLAVIIDIRFLATLPAEELLSGSSEMIKHGLISDAVYYRQLLSNLPAWLGNSAIPVEAIIHSITLKNKVVLEDPLEQGLRKILNFGHTIGHALESISFEQGRKPLSHGKAIAMGMICELYLSVEAAGLAVSDCETASAFLYALFGGGPIERNDFEPLYELMLNDKKNSEGAISFSLLQSPGNCKFDCQANQENIFKSFEFFNKYFV